jgi:hypothetical protein
MDIVTTFMSAEDKEAVTYAKRIGFKFPRYRCTTVDQDGQPYVYEGYFIPIQFRTITAEGFPECARPEGCRRLVAVWNLAKCGHYEVID